MLVLLLSGFGCWRAGRNSLTGFVPVACGAAEELMVSHSLAVCSTDKTMTAAQTFVVHAGGSVFAIVLASWKVIAPRPP